MSRPPHGNSFLLGAPLNRIASESPICLFTSEFCVLTSPLNFCLVYFSVSSRISSITSLNQAPLSAATLQNLLQAAEYVPHRASLVILESIQFPRLVPIIGILTLLVHLFTIEQLGI